MSEPHPQALRPASRPRNRGVWAGIILTVLAALTIGAWFLWGRGDVSDSKAAAAQEGREGKGGKGSGKGGRGGRGSAGGVQPVQAIAARVGDINIVQTALGTATALKTVTVKPRVDGQLKEVLFTEGQLVKEGQVLAQIDPVPLQVALQQAEGTLARDAAQLNNARLDLERYRTLLTQDSIAAQQVDQQAATVRQLEGTVKVSQAQVDNAKLQLSYTRITAPISGRLGLKQVDAGNQVRGADVNGIAVITQVDPMGVLFTIPQDNLPRVLARLRTGDKPAVEAWDREQKSLLSRGQLASTDNQIDVTTGTVKLKAQFSNTEFKLFPNQFVNVRMVVDTRKGVIVVPTAAVQRAAQGSVVYVVKDDSTVTLRPVVTGPTEGTLIAIESGLQAGERVITDGVDRIREGARVEVTEPGAALRSGGGDAGKRGGENRKRLEGTAPEPREEMKKQREGMTSEQREDWKKKRDAMTPEQREEWKKRRDAMTPEQREEWKKGRGARGEGQGKAAP